MKTFCIDCNKRMSAMEFVGYLPEHDSTQQKNRKGPIIGPYCAKCYYRHKKPMGATE